MKEETKDIVLFIVILAIVSWLFDFPAWFKANPHTVIVTMIGGVIGMIWWISDQLKEIKELIWELFDKDKK